MQQNATTELGGKNIIASGGGEEWNEDHCANGTLYKVGTEDGPPKHPERDSVDPRAPIGSWSTAGDNITYNYGTGGSYTFELWRDTCTGGTCTGTYYYCDTGGSIVATISAGPSPISCP